MHTTTFVRFHVLSQISKQALNANDMATRLAEYGHHLSSRQLSPILSVMRIQGLVIADKRKHDTRNRNYWLITSVGRSELKNARENTRQLYRDLFENTR